MADSRLSVRDRIQLGNSLILSATGIIVFVSGVAMFWGPLRQVLLAPVMMALGVAAYVAARALWWTVKQAPSRGGQCQTVNPDRYHLILTAGGRPVQHGWWGSETVARRKFTTWIGEHGGIEGARVTLVDEQDGTVLTEWPETP